MKKNYNQPIVETSEVQATSMLLDASPAGMSYGGETGGMGGGTPIGD